MEKPSGNFHPAIFIFKQDNKNIKKEHDLMRPCCATGMELMVVLASDKAARIEAMWYDCLLQ